MKGGAAPPEPPPPPPPPPPYDARIEYLESSGEQWIDTALSTADRMVGIDIELSVPSYRKNSWFCGWNQYNGGDRGGFQIGCYNNTILACLYNSHNSNPYQNYSQNITPFSTSWSRYIINALSRGIEIDGNMEVSEQIEDLGSDGGDVLLFRRGGNLSSYSASARIRYAQLYVDNNNLVRDFIPVRVGQTGYMYDRVSGQLFGNAGTGEFILGPDL